MPKKYDGLDGTELAISESQERMAVALAAADVDQFIAYAHEENLEATPIATVTAEPRVRMVWNGATIVDVSRDFLASNGAPKHARVLVEKGDDYAPAWRGTSLAQLMRSVVTDLNVASNKGLSERFDSTIGAATVLMPFGGAHPAHARAWRWWPSCPVDGETTTCSGMAWGFNPYLSEKNQFTGAYLAVVESVSKLVAAGFEHRKALPHVPGVLREAARRAQALGQARRLGARRAHGPGRPGRGSHRRQGLDERLASSSSTCRPRW